MTEEKLKQGEELLKKLSWLEDQEKRWETGTEIRSLELCNRDSFGHVDRVMQVSDNFVNFEDLKLLALVKIDKRIKEVQEQFNNL